MPYIYQYDINGERRVEWHWADQFTDEEMSLLESLDADIRKEIDHRSIEPDALCVRVSHSLGQEERFIDWLRTKLPKKDEALINPITKPEVEVLRIIKSMGGDVEFVSYQDAFTVARVRHPHLHGPNGQFHDLVQCLHLTGYLWKSENKESYLDRTHYKLTDLGIKGVS